MAYQRRAKDLARLKKEQQRMNAKIHRALKKDPASAAYLPAKTGMRDVRKLYDSLTTRADFNREIRRIQNFMKPDALNIVRNEHDEPVTKWAIHEFRVDFRAAEKNRLKRVSESAARKEAAGIEYNASDFERDMKERQANPLQYALDDFRDFAARFARAARSDANEVKLRQYRENFEKHLINLAGSDPAAAVLLEISRELTDEELVDAAENNEFLTVDYMHLYDSDEKVSLDDYKTDDWEEQNFRLHLMIRDMKNFVQGVKKHRPNFTEEFEQETGKKHKDYIKGMAKGTPFESVNPMFEVADEDAEMIRKILNMEL